MKLEFHLFFLSTLCLASSTTQAFVVIPNGSSVGVLARYSKMHVSTSATVEVEEDEESVINNENIGKLAKENQRKIAIENISSTFNPGPYYTFKTGKKLNLYGAYYGFVSIFFGIFWYFALTLCQIQRKLLPKLDPNRYGPIICGNIWGIVILKLTNNFPKIEGLENLEELYDPQTRKYKSAPMFVANHCSWMDIPYVAMAIGLKNYKMVAKHELLKVPILSKSLKECGHVLLDRSSKKSQMKAFKQGIDWLRKGVPLVTFAEGTRSKDGRLQKFKQGAFKMAEKVNSPIVPLSIHAAHKVNPIEWIFPFRSSKSVNAKIVIGKPVYTEDKTDSDVFEDVRRTIIENLPLDQRPLDEQ